MIKIFAKYDDPHTIWVQNLAGPALRDVIYLKSYQEFLGCHGQILLLPILESNVHADIVKQIIKQGNYIIFVSIHFPETTHLADLVADCPEAANFPIITSSQNQNFDSIGIDSFYFYGLTESNILRARSFTINQVFEKINKPHSFLFLNSAVRYHRHRLWHELNDQKCLDRALWSWIGVYKSRRDQENDADFKDDIPVKLLPDQYESPYWDLDRIPLYQQDQRNQVSFKTKMIHGHWTEGHVVPQQYIDTYFTLVSETSCAPGEIFVTEKTYKPILAGHPFIVLNSPGAYEYLKDELGLKTFHPVINESFDRELDLDRRISMLVSEIKTLMSRNLDEFLRMVEPICRHNQEHMIDNRYNYYLQLHHKLVAWLQARMSIAAEYIKAPEPKLLKRDYDVRSNTQIV